MPLRRDIVSGLIVVVPVAVVLLVLQHLFRRIADLPFLAVIGSRMARVPIVLVVFVMLVISVGYAMRTTVGTLVAELITDGINRIPGVRVVYNASHLAVQTAVRGAGRGVEPVKVESWDGLRVNVFDTGNRTQDGRVICFFPTAPNITTGYVIEVEEEDIVRTGERIERALIRILSAGFGEQPQPPADAVPVTGARLVGPVRDVQIGSGDGSG